ncbi:MAG: thioredoxin domain-containing protein [Acidobacteria bacterium]|nr:thioredoxin domain-containing protein [Acidobacteriota bacterium]
MSGAENLSTTVDAAGAPVIGWTSWSPTAFARAAHEQKLVFLWIAVRWAAASRAMETDALADSAVIDLVNRRFIAVKVDSDERPDINERYNLGGWPTTAILTDDGEVLTGGTSFSRDALLGLLGRSLDAVAERGDAIRAKAKEIVRARHERPKGPGLDSSAEPDRAAVSWMREQALEQVDHEYGGFVVGPAEAGPHEESGAKFLHVPVLQFLLDLSRASDDSEAATALTMSLDAMGEGALRDPRDGGFFRYTGGRDWSAPCPDKTLEDNAALLGLYTETAATFGRRDYVEIARDALRFVQPKVEAVDFATDAAADAVKACLAAAELLGDTSLRDVALTSFDRMMLNVYRPAHGVAHWYAGSPSVWGLLADQVRASAAALAVHQVTGSPVFSMLAEELMRYALRVMWDEDAGAFVDRAGTGDPDACGFLREPLRPMASNCEAACVLMRLARLGDDRELAARANRILGYFAGSYRAEGLLGAPYALAMLVSRPSDS